MKVEIDMQRRTLLKAILRCSMSKRSYKVHMFSAVEVDLAAQRYMAATGLSQRKDFYIWLGFNAPLGWEDYHAFMTPMEIEEGTSCHKKITLLLSDHWYALMKAYEARDK